MHVSFKSNGKSHNVQHSFLSHFPQFFIMNIFESKILEKMVKHVYIQLPLFKNPIFCEIMWKNVVDACRP